MMAMRRVAATFDVDPDSIKRGDELPPHWFTVFFAETVAQSELGPDGHPNKGIVLPPIPMPRRMGAGRRVKIMGRLRAGEPAVKKAEVADIVPKTGRSGDIFVLTMRHTDRAGRQDHRRRHVRRDLPPRRAARPEDHRDGRHAGAAPTRPGATPPSSPTRSTSATAALTWNAHRIHYDGDYTRSEEGYPAIVSNGGLSMHLMVDAALKHGKGALTGYTARLVHPLWVGDLIEVRGEDQTDGKMKIWAADKNGMLCGEMDLEFARERRAVPSPASASST